MSSFAFPEPPPSVAPTSLAEVDAAVAKVKDGAARWIDTPCGKRARLLQRAMDNLLASAAQWAALTNRNRGLEGNAGAEPWLSEVVPTMRCLRLLRDAMRADGQPKLPKVHTRPDGRVVATVMPVDGIDRALFAGVRAEIWLDKGKGATQGQLYRDKAAGKKRTPKVALVLGAGNVGSIMPTDTLYKLFNDDEVVVVKTNPVNAYLSPVWEATLAPFIEAGFVAVVHGGAEVGAHLCNHPDIASIHITGSDKTHDAIVWGTDPAEVARRKASGERLNDRPVSSELGCVTPVIVVPGDWSDADLDYHARGVASMVTNNASFNCVAAKALVVAKGWKHKTAFLAKLREALREVPARKAYYPGAAQRYAAFCERYPQAERLVAGGDGVVPWTLLPDVAADGSEYALGTEAFCGVLAIVELDADDPGVFLDVATRFANEQVWGNLSCTVLIDGASARAHAAALDRAVDALRFGAVAVNVFSGIVFALMTPTWGAYPGNPEADIQSGKDFVHNCLLLDHPHKSVVFAPFRIFPTPVWFEGHRGGLEVARRMVELEHGRSWAKLPGVVLHAVRA